MTSVYGYVQALDYKFKEQPLFKAAELKWQPAVGSITDILRDHPFMEVLRTGGYESMFGGTDNYFTLFVPVNVPPKSQIDTLYAKNVVRFSTLPTRATIDVIAKQSFVTPILNGTRLYVYLKNGRVYLNESTDPIAVVRPDVYATNGIIHFVERPLVPDMI